MPELPTASHEPAFSRMIEYFLGQPHRMGLLYVAHLIAAAVLAWVVVEIVT